MGKTEQINQSLAEHFNYLKLPTSHYQNRCLSAATQSQNPAEDL